MREVGAKILSNLLMEVGAKRQHNRIAGTQLQKSFGEGLNYFEDVWKPRCSDFV
jgi:hypothetical protein